MSARAAPSPVPEPLRVLLAVDGSATADALAQCWARWDPAGPPLHVDLLTVCPPSPSRPALPVAPPAPVEAALLDWGRAQSAAARDAFSTRPIDWTSEVCIGSPARSIVEQAQRRDVDLVALGTRGVNPLRGLLVGSVALRVAQSCRQPLWLMPPGARPPRALGRELRLLLAVDGSPAANAAAAWVSRNAHRFGAVRVDLVSVRPPVATLDALAPDAVDPHHWTRRLGEAALAQTRAALGATSPASAVVVDGETVAALCERADATDADAIAVAPRGLGAVGQWLLGSVTSALLQTARRPLLLLRAASSDKHPEESRQ